MIICYALIFLCTIILPISDYEKSYRIRLIIKSYQIQILVQKKALNFRLRLYENIKK